MLQRVVLWKVCIVFSGLLVVGVIENRVQCSPKGEGCVTTPC